MQLLQHCNLFVQPELLHEFLLQSSLSSMRGQKRFDREAPNLALLMSRFSGGGRLLPASLHTALLSGGNFEKLELFIIVSASKKVLSRTTKFGL